jgi:hypothetical protein
VVPGNDTLIVPKIRFVEAIAISTIYPWSDAEALPEADSSIAEIPAAPDHSTWMLNRSRLIQWKLV